MYRAVSAVVATLVVTLGLTGAGGAQPNVGSDSPVVTADGLSDVRVGDTRTTLVHEQGLRQRPGDCSPRLPQHPSVSPVFDDDELVLLWADPPVRTPDGIGVGSPVDEVRAAYPDTEALRTPEGSYRFDGLLADAGERASLFLHDGDQVQKVIVGYDTHLQRLFQDGFGTC